METRPSRERFVILALLFVATLLNYLDRAALSVTKSDIQVEIGATETQMGFLLSAFAWTVAAVSVLFSWLIQRYGARAIGTVGLAGFSGMTVLIGTASSFPMLTIYRFGLGVFEAPTFPLNAAMARAWFPKRGRARAVSTYAVGSFAGLAFAVPVLSAAQNAFGSWRAVFVFAGGIGLAFSWLWWWRVRDLPGQSSRVNAGELSLIGSGKEGPVTPGRPKPTVADWVSVFCERRLLGLYLGSFSTATVLFFFITWFPDYLKKELGFDFMNTSALIAATPYLCGMVGIVFAGFLSDHLVTSNIAPGSARKVAVTIGLLGVPTILFVPLLDGASNWVKFTLFCGTFFFTGMASTAWLLTAEIAKPRLLGVTGGVYALWANLFGALSPIVVGIILDATGGDYNAVLTYLGIVAPVGALSYLFLIDKVEPHPDKRFPDGHGVTMANSGSG